MTPEELLAQARDPFGRPRFYPPGQHPAGARTREWLRMAEELRERVVDNPELLAAIAWHERQLAVLEGGEQLAKARFLHAVSREHDG
jgi:hypothetical protein